MPPTALVVRLPNVLSPVPADWVIVVAERLALVTFAAFEIVKFPSPDKAPPKTIFPVVPALRVRGLLPPARVLLNVIPPPLADVSRLVLPVRVAAEANETAPPIVLVPAREAVPAPV
jgi:hypothetical protein